MGQCSSKVKLCNNEFKESKGYDYITSTNVKLVTPDSINNSKNFEKSGIKHTAEKWRSISEQDNFRMENTYGTKSLENNYKCLTERTTAKHYSSISIPLAINSSKKKIKPLSHRVWTSTNQQEIYSSTSNHSSNNHSQINYNTNQNGSLNATYTGNSSTTISTLNSSKNQPRNIIDSVINENIEYEMESCSTFRRSNHVLPRLNLQDLSATYMNEKENLQIEQLLNDYNRYKNVNKKLDFDHFSEYVKSQNQSHRSEKNSRKSDMNHERGKGRVQDLVNKFVDYKIDSDRSGKSLNTFDNNSIEIKHADPNDLFRKNY